MTTSPASPISVDATENGDVQIVQSPSEAGAIELLRSGEVKLHKNQAHPPMAILELVLKH